MRNIFAVTAFAALLAVPAIPAGAQDRPWLEMTLTSASFLDGGVIADPARIEDLDLRARATCFATALVALEVASGGGIRHREEIAVAGAYA